MRRATDTATPDMFEVPRPAQPLNGSHDYRIQVSGLVGHVLHDAGRDRYALAAEMSRLTGKEVSKYMLDAYSSEAREEYNLPLYLVPALEAAAHTHSITAWLADVRGARLSVGREALNTELGKLEALREETTRMIKELKRRMGEDA